MHIFSFFRHFFAIASITENLLLSFPDLGFKVCVPARNLSLVHLFFEGVPNVTSSAGLSGERRRGQSERVPGPGNLRLNTGAELELHLVIHGHKDTLATWSAGGI